MARQVPAAPLPEVGVTTLPPCRSELFMQLQQMQDELARLRGTLEEQQNQIQQLKQESLERYQDLDRRISGGGAPAAQNSAPAGAINANGAPAAPAGNNAPAPSSEPGDPAKEKLYYDAAFDLIKSKGFRQGEPGVQCLLAQVPEQPVLRQRPVLARRGEPGQGRPARCRPGFRAGQPELPQQPEGARLAVQAGGRRASPGNNDKARGILQQVISQYPGTSAAQLAQRDLKNLR